MSSLQRIWTYDQSNVLLASLSCVALVSYLDEYWILFPFNEEVITGLVKFHKEADLKIGDVSIPIMIVESSIAKRCGDGATVVWEYPRLPSLVEVKV